MGFRERLNANPAMGAVVAAVVICMAVLLIWWTMKPTQYGPPSKAFYSIDDGKTLFTDDAGKPVSFTKDGQLAVRAHVYTCDDGKTQFTAYLERIPEGVQPPAQQAEPAAAVTAKPAKNEAEARAMAAKEIQKPKVGQFVTLVKKPGDKDWLKSSDPKYFPTISPNCPDKLAKIDRVFP